MADPVLGQLLYEPYQPKPYQPGGIGTPVLDPVQQVDEKTGMFVAGCGHWFNSYNIQQDSIEGVAMKLACCPLCGYVQRILSVAQFDADPFTFIA
jgi:hypothetical protein